MQRRFASGSAPFGHDDRGRRRAGRGRNVDRLLELGRTFGGFGREIAAGGRRTGKRHGAREGDRDAADRWAAFVGRRFEPARNQRRW